MWHATHVTRALMRQPCRWLIRHHRRCRRSCSSSSSSSSSSSHAPVGDTVVADTRLSRTLLRVLQGSIADPLVERSRGSSSSSSSSNRGRRRTVLVDATLGAGGHTALMLRMLRLWEERGAQIKVQPPPEPPLVVAMDCDLEAVRRARETFREEVEEGRLRLVHANFAEWKEVLVRELGGQGGPEGEEREVPQVDAAVFDFGLSETQLESQTRGFSFRFPHAALDMRTNPDGWAHEDEGGEDDGSDTRKLRSARPPSDLTAAKIVNRLGREQLEELFLRWGGEPLFREIVEEIVRFRERPSRSGKRDRRIETVKDLTTIIARAVRRSQRRTERQTERKAGDAARSRPPQPNAVFARIFLALRVAVNNEMNAIAAALMQAHEVIKPGGSLLTIAYRPLEDAKVFQVVNALALSADNKQADYQVNENDTSDRKEDADDMQQMWRPLFDTAIQPTPKEKRQQPRLRSAHLRAFTKHPFAEPRTLNDSRPVVISHTLPEFAYDPVSARTAGKEHEEEEDEEQDEPDDDFDNGSTTRSARPQHRRDIRQWGRQRQRRRRRQPDQRKIQRIRDPHV